MTEEISQQAINAHIAILCNPAETDARKDTSGNALYEEIYRLRAALDARDAALKVAEEAILIAGEALKAMRPAGTYLLATVLNPKIAAALAALAAAKEGK